MIPPAGCFIFAVTMKKRIQEILAAMKADTFERDDAMALSLLSALSGESIFLLGLPGVGKSMMARRLKLAFKDARVFEYLMSRFSTPDEIFGPVSISKLKDNDCYERVTAGYLPEAEVVFLDEIWKAGPAIQNSLLTALNERIFINGNREMKLPMKGIIAASNELPAKDEGLEALWDRFLIRYIVNPIDRKQNFIHLLESQPCATTPPKFKPLTESDFNSIQSKSKQVRMPGILLDLIYDIRVKLNNKIDEKDPVTGESLPENIKYYVSDRRWKKAVGVMRMSAFLNGREETDLSDLMLLSHMLWNDVESIPVVQQILFETIVAALFRQYLDNIKSSVRHVKTDSQPAFFSPDKKNYILQCDGNPMKITIKDYEALKANSGTLHYGAETTDGNLIIRARGPFIIKYIQEGVIAINGFNYSLKRTSDSHLTGDFITEAGDSVDAMADRLFGSMNQNLFTASSSLYAPLQNVIAVYRTRIKSVK